MFRLHTAGYQLLEQHPCTGMLSEYPALTFLQGAWGRVYAQEPNTGPHLFFTFPLVLVERKPPAHCSLRCSGTSFHHCLFPFSPSLALGAWHGPGHLTGATQAWRNGRHTYGKAVVGWAVLSLMVDTSYTTQTHSLYHVQHREEGLVVSVGGLHRGAVSGCNHPRGQ